MPWGHTVDKEIQYNYAIVQLKQQTLTLKIYKHYKHIQLFFIYSYTLKIHWNSYIFRLKTCFLHPSSIKYLFLYCLLIGLWGGGVTSLGVGGMGEDETSEIKCWSKSSGSWFSRSREKWSGPGSLSPQIGVTLSRMLLRSPTSSCRSVASINSNICRLVTT